MKAFRRRNFLSKFLETEGAFVRDRERRNVRWAPVLTPGGKSECRNFRVGKRDTQASNTKMKRAWAL